MTTITHNPDGSVTAKDDATGIEVTDHSSRLPHRNESRARAGLARAVADANLGDAMRKTP